MISIANYHFWGSPKVVKKWNDFRQKSLEGNKQLEPKELLNAVEEVMNEMRKGPRE